VAAPAVHFAFGAAVGAVYGAYVERVRGGRPASGVGVGTALWITADEIAMPAFGLSGPTTRRPLEKHLQSFAAHMVYGTVAELVRNGARRAI
jgi:uncharacterized membrane protein YagU involved in acid resistance